jgi:hypothetical protein
MPPEAARQQQPRPAPPATVAEEGGAAALHATGPPAAAPPQCRANMAPHRPPRVKRSRTKKPPPAQAGMPPPTPARRQKLLPPQLAPPPLPVADPTLGGGATPGQGSQFNGKTVGYRGNRPYRRDSIGVTDRFFDKIEPSKLAYSVNRSKNSVNRTRFVGFENRYCSGILTLIWARGRRICAPLAGAATRPSTPPSGPHDRTPWIRPQGPRIRHLAAVEVEASEAVLLPPRRVLPQRVWPRRYRPWGSRGSQLAPPTTAGREGQGRGVLAGRGWVAAQVSLGQGNSSGREVCRHRFFLL